MTAPPPNRWWVTVVLATAGPAAVIMTLAPTDAVQGDAQRWMYLHVPAAWCAYLCFFLVLLASAQQLRTASEGSGRLGRAAAEVGVVLTAATLLTGSIWGHLAWGTWWAWDARVTTTVALGLVYLGYLGLRGALDGTRHRLIALVGIFGFAMVPIVHFSVVWWRTLHQPATILAPTLNPPIDPRMGLALAISLLAFTVATAWALHWRLRSLQSSAAAPAPARALLSEPSS